MMHADGTVHLSDLKRFALSPAHYRDSVLHPRETTRQMRIGTLVDMLLLTDRVPVVYAGERRGNAWKAFREKFPGEEIFTESEHDDARAIAATVRRDPLAIEYLGLDDPDRRTQVPLKWETNGVPRSTRGIDVITRGKLVDLKVTNSAHPDRFAWHARRQLWHAQLADYADACEQNGIAFPNGVFLVGVEATPPHCVTVLRMGESALTEGRKCIALWIEQFKACAASGEWPGYVQSPVDLDVEIDPEIVVGDEEDYEDV